MDIYSKVIFDLVKVLVEKVQGTESVSETKDLSVIDEEAKRQALELQMAHAQAKVAQEIAIAQRIENAKEVIIEEYYEGEAEGKAGVTGNETGITVGVSGAGRKVTKRIYRFVGGEKILNDKNTYESET
jgi:hypothetical protein